MERTAPFAMCDFRFRRARRSESQFSWNRNESIERGVEVLDALQASLREFNRGNFFLPQERCEFEDGSREGHAPIAALHCRGRLSRDRRAALDWTVEAAVSTRAASELRKTGIDRMHLPLPNVL